MLEILLIAGLGLLGGFCLFMALYMLCRFVRDR
jgi:hypothetical protein